MYVLDGNSEHACGCGLCQNADNSTFDTFILLSCAVEVEEMRKLGNTLNFMANEKQKAAKVSVLEEVTCRSGCFVTCV